MSWTQAICRECWNERNPERQVTNAATIHVGDVCCYRLSKFQDAAAQAEAVA